ncbi:PTS sugar transporter subunit IIA [Sutterella sp.]|uniref:PTS sugar transporter subunit IIA n=1 Tax=Sutterella sp. TaxID=1981025 RepID=UPI0026E0C96C|nr:PTS fructose transporter subunit IIA [Sutterella sp.]MDO5530400.1 PTS fructose transporter subunit IIA [Sutterella sp.]
MPTGICIIAHAPLASALKTCAEHVYSTTGDKSAERIVAWDVPCGIDVEAGLEHGRELVETLCAHNDGVLIFTDLTGATPGNIARRLLADKRVRVVSGTNLPAIVAALSAPADAPLSQVATIAEAAARASLSALVDICD